MIRSIVAIVLALVAWMAVATVLNLGIRHGWADYAAAEPTMHFTLPMQLARLLLGVVASLAAGFVVTFVARGAKRPVYVVVAVLLLSFIPVHYKLWDQFPAWYHLFFLASLVVFTLLGAASRSAPAAK